MIKLIATDLDGTLLDRHKQIPPANLQAIEYARQKGVQVVLCTGRPYRAVEHLLDQVGRNPSHEDYLILFNGAMIRRASDGAILHQASLDLEDLKRWQVALDALALPLNVIDQDWVYEPLTYPPGRESFYVSKVTQAPSQRVDFATFPPDQTFLKFVITIDSDYLQGQMQQLPEDLLADYSVCLSHPFQLEVMAKGVDKGQALRGLGQTLGISLDQMMAIGDQMNDLTMMTQAGVGVAMANAISELKQVADYVTGDHNQDGVAQAIYHYLD